ncbi:hypothetical protein [Poritiphilus flavus]|uniref:SbsA Ig-like domain-containing protein n=1 Tax=Poritiphilus flavus TaxID=2697053 RepID=A0A6L9EG90_9FLAO|nr:hypothetical protein [Poritiphilus flavus]NAS13662.1 hypothetical protein [Poritiphilus flavus]
MDVIRPIKILKKIRLVLVFFCFAVFFWSCQSAIEPKNIEVLYKEGKAVAVSFNSGAGPEQLGIFLEGEKRFPVLGDLTKSRGKHTFTPVVPFSKNQTYEIRYLGETLESFTIRSEENELAPEILNIYPTRDTVPENLLKMYLVFSQPMQQVGNALDFVRVFDETKQKEVKVFLELESELWNAEHNRLTLWLDPGRIKTDLIPNREQGLPIKQGHRYRLEIDQGWRDANGNALKESVSKRFYVGSRDVGKPNPKGWEILLPKSGSKGVLKLNFGEPLDAILAKESIAVYSDSGEPIEGELDLISKEKGIKIIPVNNWKKGKYKLLINSRLEDLSGNNLNRLFDRDVDETVSDPSPEKVHKISFRIE